jgi:hypothetical protein
MDGSETNFSGWRGAVDEARKGFVADQMNLVRRLNRPAYMWKLSQYLEDTKDKAIKRAFGKIGDKIFAHNWNLPTWSYIEPVADSEGDASQIRNGQTSPRRMQAARGKDHETIVDETVEDNAYAITKAQRQADEINAKFPGVSLTWRDLMPLPMVQGQTIALQDPAAIAVQEANVGADGEAVAAPSGEFAGITRQQWNRNRKAIKDVLDEMIAGTTSEAAARVFLSGIGLAASSVDALITDAKDGQIDTPEVTADA